MDSAGKNGGGFGVQSIPVPNVQSLAGNNHVKEIPSKYIRPEISDDIIIHGGALGEIPVIDLGRLVDPNFSEHEASKLNMACESWGFFQLVNHGVSEEILDKVRVDINEFFKLPLEEKKAFAQLPGDLQGYGQMFVTSEDQKLDWADMLYLVTLPVSSRALRFWPTYPSTFRDTFHNYSSEVKRITNCLLGSMSESLGLEEEKLINMFEKGMQSTRTNYYPPCPAHDKVLGLSPHSDAVGLTLVLQLNEVHGLQIMRNGAWLLVKPLPGAFIVNIGDVLEIMSNGKYKSILHRATVSSEKERLSIATFHMLNFGDTVGPMPELVRGGEVHYKSLVFEEYMKYVFSSKLEGTNILDHMKLKG